VDALIRTEEATKVYNRGSPDEVLALSQVSVEIGRGEVAVLRGPSGSGKTTLLSLLGCMSRPTSGRVIVDGRDVGKLPERFLTAVRRREFGFVFQQFHLIRRVSVLDNVLLPLYPIPMRVAEMERRAETVLSRLRLWEKRRLRPSQLSGGEQQRVAIARALVNAPEAIIADEPTAHLDSELAGELLELLEGLHREGKTVVIATHDPFVYDHPSVQRVISMRDGRVESVSTR
jgi:putative ABC transport system ATP-binding protein